MQVLMQAVYNAVMEFYDRGKPWKEDFVKFTIEFDEQGRVVTITYTPFPAEHTDALLEAKRACSTLLTLMHVPTYAHLMRRRNLPSD